MRRLCCLAFFAGLALATTKAHAEAQGQPADGSVTEQEQSPEASPREQEEEEEEESSAAPHNGRQGHLVQVTNFGVPMWVHNFENGTDTTIADKLSISQFIGAHYFITDSVRLGMMVQFTQQFTGNLAKGADHWTTFALLPQVGWHFYKNFYVAGVFTYAPRSGGKDALDLGVQAVLGGSIPITKCASFGYAVEVPYNFHVARTIGVTPLIGLSYRL